MRQRTPDDVAYRWHRNALKGVYGDDIPSSLDDPQAGWFKRTLVRGGVYVPARIWIVGEYDLDTGELLSPEEFQCEVDGQYADAYEQWSWLCRNPISEQEFNYLTAMRRHAEVHEPTLPIADPRKPVDWLTAPLPVFSSKRTPST